MRLAALLTAAALALAGCGQAAAIVAPTTAAPVATAAPSSDPNVNACRAFDVAARAFDATTNDDGPEYGAFRQSISDGIAHATGPVWAAFVGVKIALEQHASAGELTDSHAQLIAACARVGVAVR